MSARISSGSVPKEASQTPVKLAFDRFQVVPHHRELLADGQPVRLGGRAFDVLMALIDARGAVVSKDDLMTRVWPDRIVEEGNLVVHISAVRAALAPNRDLIRTLSGRGYLFTGEVRPLPLTSNARAGAERATKATQPAPPQTNLPALVAELIGRDQELRKVVDLAAAHRLVTLTGPGGIGKTQLAIAAARQLRPGFADGVWVAEFSRLSNPDLVPATVAAAIGLAPVASEVSAQDLARMLSGRRLLLLLDTCEHIAAATAALAETLSRACPFVHIIATSREPLRMEGEQTHPVPPLAVPPANSDDPGQYSATQLFIAKTRANGAQSTEDRHAASLIAAICRQLDGNPLAIELAAARTFALGVEELATHLAGGFLHLTGGWRTALPRHRTLRATFDWSHELLSDPERVVLRRLAIFAGCFSLEAADAIVTADLAVSDVVDSLASLVAKSLVVVEFDCGIARYRLLNATRAYALEKLLESGERDRLAHRHDEYFRALFATPENGGEGWPKAERPVGYRTSTDNALAAFDEALAPDRGEDTGVAVTGADGHWTHMSQSPRRGAGRGRAAWWQPCRADDEDPEQPAVADKMAYDDGEFRFNPSRRYGPRGVLIAGRATVTA